MLYLVTAILVSVRINGKKVVKFNVSQFKMKTSISYSSNTLYYRTLTTSPINHSHIYKA